MTTKKISRSLSMQIRRHLLTRVCVCFFIFSLIISAVIWQYFSFYITQSENTARHINEELTPYIISQEIIKNRYSIGLKIKDVESLYNVKISYFPKGFYKDTVKNSGLKLNNHFNWDYYVKIPVINDINYGYYIISGSILNDKLILKSILGQIVILIVFVMLFIYALLPIGNSIPQNLFVKPIKKLLKLLSDDNHQGLLDFSSSTELVMLRDELVKLIEKKEEAIKSKQLIKIGRQVAHDIRSPLSAIMSVISEKDHLDLKQINIIKSAADSLSNIANGLLVEYKISQGYFPVNTTENKYDKNPVYPMLSEVVFEKNSGYIKKKIEINLNVLDGAIFSSISVDSQQFKSVVSNIINNSIDAIDIEGTIDVSLKNDCNFMEIKISDNGRGIPVDILPKIRTYGFSHGKENGNGIGLYHATEYINKIGGSLSIDSESDVGTVVTVRIPLSGNPDWLSTGREIPSAPNIVILDDDPSIHGLWLDLLSDLHGAKIHQFHLIDDFRKSSINSDEIDLFLVDYHFRGYDENGFDFITGLGISDRSLLVTSKYLEKEFQEICIKNRVTILPKQFLKYIKDDFFNYESHYILIDDSQSVIDAWELRSHEKNINFVGFTSAINFLDSIGSIGKKSNIYIDFNLGGELTGTAFAKELHSKGFHNLYLCTGYEKNDFHPMNYIKDIVGKEPPF